MILRMVWRVERNGLGIYRDPDLWIPHDLTIIARSPIPEEDKLLNWDEEEHGEHLFGFATLKSYRRWFHHKARTWLSENGAVLVKYSVPTKDVIIGRRQVIFNPRDAARISRTFNPARKG